MYVRMYMYTVYTRFVGKSTLAILTQGIKPANSIFRYAIYMSYDSAGSLLAV